MRFLYATATLAVSLFAPACVFADGANQNGDLIASVFANWSVQKGDISNFTWSNPTACTMNTGGVTFPAFTVGTPIKIVESSQPANTEIVTPFQVTITGSGCLLRINPVHPHYSFYITSATAGLQEALNYAGAQPYAVDLTPDWPRAGGTTAMISAVTGKATILDRRTAQLTSYAPNGTGTGYVATALGGGGTGTVNGKTLPATLTASDVGADPAGAASAAQAAAIAASDPAGAAAAAQAVAIAAAIAASDPSGAAATAKNQAIAASDPAGAAATAQATAIAAAANASNLTSGTVPASRLPQLPYSGLSGLPTLGAAASHGASTNVNGIACALDGSCTISTDSTGVAGTVADGVTDDSAALASACPANTDIHLKAGATYYLANNTTLSCAVHIPAGTTFSIANGKTLYFNGKIDAQPTSVFTGAGSVSLGFNNTEVPVEWFGAVGDFSTTSKTGTDNTSAIQNALNSLYAGHVVLQPRYYAVSSALQVARSNIGIRGTSSGYTYPSTSRVSILFNTSASADTLDVGGTSSAYTVWNDFRDFSVQRSIAPTGTATGISVNYAGGYSIDHVQSMDSVRGFYFHSAPGYGVGSITNTNTEWGFSLVPSGAYTSGSTMYGYYLDSADGLPEDTIVFRNVGSGTNTGSTPTTYGFYIYGAAINDVDVTDFNSASESYGVWIQYAQTGGSPANAGAASDVHFNNTTIDNFSKAGITVSGVTAAALGSVDFSGGWVTSIAAGVSAGIDVEGSSGITFSKIQLNNRYGDGFVGHNSDSLMVNSMPIEWNAGHGLIFTNTKNSTIVGNAFRGAQLNPTGTMAAFIGSTKNTIVGNSFGGYGTTAISFDAASTGNAHIGNAIDTTSITTAVSDPASVATTTGGATPSTSYGTGSSLSRYSIVPGTTANSYLGDVIGSQFWAGINAYYNGSAWIAPSAAAVSGTRANNVSLGNSALGGVSIVTCPVQTVGATVAGLDTTCIGQTTATGVTNAGTTINRTWINPQTYTQIPGDDTIDPAGITRTIGSDASLTVNKPTTLDHYASVVLAAGAAADKGLVVQGVSGQTANLTEWQTSTGASTVFIGPDGTLQEKDTTNGHVYRIVITNGTITLQQVN